LQRQSALSPWTEDLWGQNFESSLLQKYSFQFKTPSATSPTKLPSSSPDHPEVFYRY